MPEKYAPPPITRSEVVVVKSSYRNTYGDLIFTDTLDKEHKVGNKRSQLFSIIEEGNGLAVKLDYSSYMNKEYIAGVSLFDGLPPVEKRIEPITAGVEPSKLAKEAVKLGAEPTTDNMSKKDWAEKDKITRKSIERQTSLNAAVKLAEVGVLKPDQIMPSAKIFEYYLETGEEIKGKEK